MRLTLKSASKCPGSELGVLSKIISLDPLNNIQIVYYLHFTNEEIEP